MDTGELKFQNLFKLAVFGLRISRSHPDLPRNFKWFAAMAGIVFINCWCIILLFYSIIMHDIKNRDISKIFRQATIILTSFIVILKYFLLFYHKNGLINIIYKMDRDYDKSTEWDEEEQEIIKFYIKKQQKICKIWCVTALMISSVYPIQSVLSMLYNYWMDEFELVSMFVLTYPPLLEKHKNDIIIYTYLYVIHILYAGNVTTIFMGFDPLGPIFTLHACALLRVARLRVLKVYSGSKDEAEKKLKEVIHFLLYIYSFVDDINRIFIFFNEVNVKCTAMLISFTAFQEIRTVQKGQFSFEYFNFLIGSVLHFYLPCLYGNHLKEAGEKVFEAMYLSNWEKHPNIKSRLILLNMMTRLRKPPLILSFFGILSLGSFAQMCHQAYAILNFITATSR